MTEYWVRTARDRYPASHAPGCFVSAQDTVIPLVALYRLVCGEVCTVVTMGGESGPVGETVVEVPAGM